MRQQQSSTEWKGYTDQFHIAGITAIIIHLNIALRYPMGVVRVLGSETLMEFLYLKAQSSCQS